MDASLNLGLRPPAPGRVPAPAYRDERDPPTGYRNGQGIHDYTVALADRITQALNQGNYPLVLGGDCSILLGAMLALKRKGPTGTYGLMFVDGHNDYCPPLHPEQFPAFAAAGLDLALVAGHGPEALTNSEGAGPYVREEHVALLGC
jgi:arginase